MAFSAAQKLRNWVRSLPATIQRLRTTAETADGRPVTPRVARYRRERSQWDVEKKATLPQAGFP